MSKFKTIKYIALSGGLGFLFTVLIYNIDVVLHLIEKLYENEIVIYIAITIFYFFLYRFLKKKLLLKPGLILLICVLTPIIIDASVLITNPLFVPGRFPFASIFPLLGAGLAILFDRSDKKLFITGLFFSAILFYLSHKYILPRLWFSQFERMSSKIPDSIFQSKFYTVEGNSIILSDTCNARCNLLDCFFVGCLPCEEKRSALDSLRHQFAERDLNIVLICNGKLTVFEKFAAYANKYKSDGITFLYDKDSVLLNQIDIKGYPFEMLTNRNTIINQFTGFDSEIFDDYITGEKIKINKIINE